MLITRLVAACLLVTFVPVPVLADPETRVRCSHPRLRHLLTEGHHRSATFRDLVARLQASDVIVHVEAAPPGHFVDGGLQFVTATASTRYVRVTLRTDLPMGENVALLGHELRHAVEVAEAPGIRDEASFQRFYDAVGRPHQRGRMLTYDTRAAIETGLRVALELRVTAAHRTSAQER